MISFECKNCGGELEIVSDGIGRCTSCRSKQPIPKINDEKFNRANKLRLENINFDDARAIYEKIVDENPNEAEAYWGIVLCRYGIEYVKDYTGEYKPTCHRIIESSIEADEDFKKAVSCAPSEQNRVYYIEQARMIDAIQQRIIAIANSEKPYDIFISFKATDDETKEETLDSKRATNLYYELQNKGYRVFFSKETLKYVAGSEYEPYIYAALKSSKVMLLVGTKTEYMNAKWVKNEWRRYIVMRQNGEKKLLLPIYENMDPYDFPFELRGFQALNMSEMSFLPTLLENIEKFVGESSEDRKKRETQEDILKMLGERGVGVNKAEGWNENGKRLLELSRYADAEKEFTAAIEENPRFANAYWNRLLAVMKQSEKTIISQAVDFTDSKDYMLAVSCATGEERDNYERIGQLCKGNLALQMNYDGDCKRTLDAFVGNPQSGNNPDIVNGRFACEASMVKQEEKMGRIRVASIKQALVFAIISVVFIVGFFIMIASSENSEPSMTFMMVVGLFGSGPMLGIFTCLNSDKKGLRIWSFILGMISFGFISVPIVFIISVIQVFVNKSKVNHYTKLSLELKQLKSDYSEILNTMRNQYMERCNCITANYESENVNKNYILRKNFTQAYDSFEASLKNRFL